MIAFAETPTGTPHLLSSVRLALEYFAFDPAALNRVKREPRGDNTEAISGTAMDVLSAAALLRRRGAWLVDVEAATPEHSVFVLLHTLEKV